MEPEATPNEVTATQESQATSPRPTIKTSFAELKKHGIEDACLLENLQGYDSDIINLMIKHDIFPQTFYILGQIYVSRAHINLVTNRLLRTQMHMYETMENLEDAKAKAIKYLEDNKIKLDENDVIDIASGRKTLSQIVDERTQATHGTQTNNEVEHVDATNET